MAAIPFQIEFVEPNRGFVIARQLEGGAFRVVGDTTLGDCPVTAMDMPRAKDAEGNLRKDLFAFRLLFKEDAAELKVGSIAQLANYRDA